MLESRPIPAIARAPAVDAGVTEHVLAPRVVVGALIGVVVLQTLPQLPARPLLGVLLGLGLLAVWRLPRQRWLGAMLLAAAWAGHCATLGLQRRLTPALEGEDLEVIGVVVDLPDRRDDATRFDLRVISAVHAGSAVDLRGVVRLSWYGESPVLPACSRWQLRLRLKRPRGLLNPGGIDFERHALQQGIVATGYVRDDGDNRPLTNTSAVCVDRWREAIAAAITREIAPRSTAALLRALAVGDQRGLNEDDWQVLRATGVGHLIAISGFHVGMLAALGALLMRQVWKRWTPLLRWMPGHLWESPVALVCALMYCALAGFGLATTRTLLMIAVVALARMLRRHVATAQGLALAMAAILLVDPLAVLSAGFWLSFAGVAWLLFCLGDEGRRAWWHELWLAQGAMTLGLLPLCVWFFRQSSIVGPLANLIAVPWISAVVVPLTLSGSLLILAVPAVGALLLQGAALCMQWQWWLLCQLAALPWAQWHFREADTAAFVLAVLGSVWLLMPRGMPARWLGASLLLPLLWPTSTRPAHGAFDVAVLDVGQGLSVLVRTQGHALLFDAGARFPSGFDMGEAVVVPAVQALGVNALDRFIVSHSDNDHAGGARAVVRALRPADVLVGEASAELNFARACRAGESWRWDDVTFRILHPGVQTPTSDNDRSCVLLIDAAGSRLLLSGDITAAVEASVAAQAGPAPLVLLVPHHGSKTSSSDALLDALDVRLALISAGYRSRFGHPHAQVLARYAARNIPILNTADSGCLRLAFVPQREPVLIERCRLARTRYWTEL